MSTTGAPAMKCGPLTKQRSENCLKPRKMDQRRMERTRALTAGAGW